jgi:hypothetical protein
MLNIQNIIIKRSGIHGKKSKMFWIYFSKDKFERTFRLTSLGTIKQLTNCSGLYFAEKEDFLEFLDRFGTIENYLNKTYHKYMRK